MAYSLLLDVASWDLTLDSAGNIATTEGGYAIAQNVANAVRLFTNDAYFDTDRGIPHFDIELGNLPPVSILYTEILKAANSVEGVATSEVEFTGLEERTLKGEISLTTTDGETARVDL